jgi:phosphate transport system substrate-binding protein
MNLKAFKFIEESFDSRFARLRTAAALCLVAVLGTVHPAAASNMTVKGSDTMLVIAQRWAEVYMKEHPGTTIQVTGGGSGTGIAALINGTTDLANSSRKIKSEEIAAVKAAKHDPVEFLVALDALSVVVHKSNPVKTLSVAQIGKIYSGYINNWKQVGGPDHAIIRYSRESSSGTYGFIKDEVMKGRDYAPDCQTMPGTAAVAEAVARDPWGIGYGGVSYFAKQKDLKILPLSEKDGGAAISPLGADGEPNAAVVYDKTYPLQRGLYIYTAGQPTGDKKAYLDWILSPPGQKIVSEVEYIPLRKS